MASAREPDGTWSEEWAQGLLASTQTSTPIYSTREVQQILRSAHGQAGLEQVSYLARAGVLGQTYTSGGSTLFDAKHVDELVKRPLSTLDDLCNLKSMQPVDGALVIRQLPLTPADDPVEEARPFIGTHAALFDLPQTDDRRQALDEATRQCWRLAPRRRSNVWQHIAEHGYCPLIVTIGKFCLGGRDIHSLHVIESGPYTGRVAFEISDAGAWVDDVRHTWLDAGTGPSIAWWQRPSE